MEGFSDLLADAFSEASVPSFPDGDLDFENLNFDERSEEDQTEELTAKQEEAVFQEATGVLFGEEAEDMAENVYAEQTVEAGDDFKSAGVGVGSESPEEGYTSSDGDPDEEDSVSSEEDEDEDEDVGRAEKPGDLLMSVRCSDDDNKEDRIFAEERPLTPQGAEIPQAGNKEQGEAESDEEVSYFERVPERGTNGTTVKGAGTEEDEQESEEEGQDDSSDPECEEGMKIDEEETVAPSQGFEKEVESPCKDDPPEPSLEFPCLSLQNLEDLIAEVDGEECVEKMKEFSGEEHQEAGETFADYPSDFSSCEYVEDRRKNHESEPYALPCSPGCGPFRRQNEGGEKVEDTDDTEDGFLYSLDLEKDVHKMDTDVAGREEHRVTLTREETVESDSYSSSDDEVCDRRTREEDNDLENNNQLDGAQRYEGSYAAFSRWSNSDDRRVTDNGAGLADYMSWDFNVLKTDTFLSEYLETTEDTSKTEAAPLERPAEDVNSYSVVQREDTKTTSPSDRGSLDDSFFFNTEIEASGITELGQLGDDEYEDERNWDQEKERIEAFYKFYNDSDEENGREERHPKVQFCTDPLSQVIHYETESSDTDSLTSSTDREEDLSSAEASDEPRVLNDIVQTKPACDPPKAAEPPASPPDLTQTQTSQTCTRKNKCLNALKLILKTGVVTVMGLLVYWLATDQADWLSQVFYF
ncbi:protein starmaker [Mugil cephalus]|uniref:protein starmaker n=1 Tax=Mugil cephalus TaxID=48193 RepID=UPI001FB7E756|nr:protein starmaker [Mugil cephalus]